MNNLHSAWRSVRSNIVNSGQSDLKNRVDDIEDCLPAYLRRIQAALANRKFRFSKHRGYKKKKSSGGYRGIVVAPIDDRIIQRAILNVLQSAHPKIIARLGKIPEALTTPTSVGGIPGRGVGYGMHRVREAINNGQTFFIRSDIRDFFTKIPKEPVLSFIREETQDSEFSDLLAAALRTELENEDEVKEWLNLFPSDDIGVPQGSSLSAFAGNIVLRDFDRTLNGRGVTTIRYIDDFIVLGKNEKHVKKAFGQGREILRTFQMTAYAPWENCDKATMGNIASGFDFLGCHLNSEGIMPSRKARAKFLQDLQSEVRQSKISIRRFSNVNLPRRAEDNYVQTLARIDRKVRGWGDTYGFADLRQPFRQLDHFIDELVDSYAAWFDKNTVDRNNQIRRRMMGISLLADAKVTSAQSGIESTTFSRDAA